MKDSSTLWETYFHHRANLRLNENSSVLSNTQTVHLFELFIGPNEKRFSDQEPYFATLQEAIDCADCDASREPWRIRDIATGTLIIDSELGLHFESGPRIKSFSNNEPQE